MSSIKIPVLIAGGGPAGMATAIVLASRGIMCVVAEPVIELEPKAGETIPPSARQLFAKLGIEALLGAREHLPCYGNKFVWGSLGEKDFFGGVYGHGWHLNRVHFEKQLRALVQGVIAGGIIGYRITHCMEVDDGWKVLLQDEKNNVMELLCNFLVDATGRVSRVARILGIQRKRLDKLTGLWCVIDTVDQIKPFYTFIEAVADGWWYAAPLQDKKLSLAFMTDSDLLHASMVSGRGYFEAARKLPLINPLVKDISAAQVQPTVYPASTSYITTRVGRNWLAAGDAAYAYDPISSYGILSSLENGFFAGHTIADSYSGDTEAIPAYDFLISSSFSNYLKMHALQYLQETRWRNEPFWQRRSPN
ncbi:MAG: FAD-dependent monooxygenase [Williamsia sp.]|nr:FAD-dependent monooxygenase [Williamsia sp.]